VDSKIRSGEWRRALRFPTELLLYSIKKYRSRLSTLEVVAQDWQIPLPSESIVMVGDSLWNDILCLGRIPVLSVTTTTALLYTTDDRYCYYHHYYYYYYYYCYYCYKRPTQQHRGTKKTVTTTTTTTTKAKNHYLESLPGHHLFGLDDSFMIHDS
jgi:hypothetical protein